MGRIRSIKPEFFKHEDLFDAERETGLPLRVAFPGLWTAADREGRFEWRPRQLKTDILPYDDIDFSRVLDALTTRGFIVKYRVSGQDYGYIPSWHRHQVINNRERPSHLPEPNENNILHATATRDGRDDGASITRHGNCKAEGKGKEGEGKGREQDSAAGAARVVPSEPLTESPELPIEKPSPKSAPGALDKKKAAAGARWRERQADPFARRNDGGFETHAGNFVSFEEALWELEAPAAAAGIPASMLGKLWRDSPTPADAYDALETALRKDAPKRYLAGALRRLEADAAHEDAAANGHAAHLPGDPKHVPRWILDKRAEGEVITRDGKSWRWDGGLFDDAGNETGF